MITPTPMSTRGEELTRMRDDLRRALKKPVGQRRWAMIVNTRRCTGCYACVVACMAENCSPPGVAYRRVADVESGEYPQVMRIFMPANMIAGWGAGMLLRFVTLVLHALVGIKVMGYPPAPALLSLAAFFFVSTLIEPVFLKP